MFFNIALFSYLEKNKLPHSAVAFTTAMSSLSRGKDGSAFILFAFSCGFLHLPFSQPKCKVRTGDVNQPGKSHWHGASIRDDEQTRKPRSPSAMRASLVGKQRHRFIWARRYSLCSPSTASDMSIRQASSTLNSHHRYSPFFVLFL